MDFQRIISGKNKTQILHDGFRLQWNRGPQGPLDTTYFTCTEKACKATLATTGDLNGELTLKYHRKEQHNHPSDIAKTLVASSLSDFRQQVKTNPDVPAKQIFDDISTAALESVSTPNKFDLAKKLPTYRTVKDQAYRQRKAKRPNLPKSIDEVNIPLYSDLTTTKNNKPFYRGKTKGGSELFMSDAQLGIADSADSIFVDGTFSICPQPFYQVLFINAKFGENVYQLATALLPNKLETTYREVLELLRDVVAENGKSLDPLYAHSDCEMAIINAIKFVFPNTQIRLCRFHIVDASRRYANSIGARPLINRHQDFKTFYHRSRQIMFFPIDYWPRIWKLIVNSMSSETTEIPAVQRFMEYLVSFICY